jgi:redox-sensitive bicupin YhaK (pirin superfamily)
VSRAQHYPPEGGGGPVPTAERGPPSVRIVPGVVDSHNVTARLVLPTSQQGAWPPFVRVAESIAAVGRRFPQHAHEAEEVLTFEIEGNASYEIPPSPAVALDPGCLELLASSSKVTHAIRPAGGTSVRWFSLVVSLPAGAAVPTRAQFDRPTASALQADGTVVRRLVGPGARTASACGLEAEEITFGSEGTSFRRVGRDRRGLVYAFAGRGGVDNEPLELGEAALIENASGIALRGARGFRVVVATLPRVS